ncbi:MAG: Methyltransferase type 11 [Bacteroidetes bacterium]|nr:Methyltransferase type 11 [Bacteroidota bacterium]MBM2845593.1 Methyltransferase type 11 [Bacteroidota bacterium]
MNENSMEPYGLALLDYFNGDHSATQIFHRDDGRDFEVPISLFFRDSAEFSRIEQAAIELCSGRVLDIGAGTGRHSLVLQEKGLDVIALDVSPHAIDIMKNRGVRGAYHADIFEFNQGKFDTLLMLLHGIGMVGTLAGLRRFLNHAHTLIDPGGIIVFDSLDVRCTDDPVHLAYHERNRNENRFIGEIHFQIEYKGLRGSPFSWLQVDPETLDKVSMDEGWDTEIICREPSGDYLARLSER